MTICRRAVLALQLCFCLAVKLACRLLPGRKKYEEIWLFSERGYDAADNAWAFFCYVRERAPEKKVFYIMASRSSDIEKVKARGRVLKRGSLRHLFLYFLPTVKISTHILGAAPYPMLFSARTGRRLLHAPGVSVFLQHGVTCGNIPALYAQNTCVDLFVCAALPEYEFVRSHFGYPEQAVCCPGFARFDALQDAAVRRQILFLPTWRTSLASLLREEFLATPYFSAVQSLLSSAQLYDLLEREDLYMVFAPHPELRKFLSCFRTKSRRIVFSDKDIGELVRSSAMLITDYSSVMFDFAYAGRPVLYWDVEGLREPHYPVGYFSRERDGFGPVVKSLPGLCSAIENLTHCGFFPDAPYRAHADRFFPRRDRNNCRRNFDVISEWIAKNRNI